MNNRFSRAAIKLGALAIAACAGTASAQPAITVIDGFLLQSWNAGTGAGGYTEWNPEKPATGFGQGLRWEYLATDGVGAVIPQYATPINDPAFPGITGALEFPAAAAVGPVATAWEGQALAGESGTFEIWFKPSDLSGTHVLFETGAVGKGVAFVLDGNELVYAQSATDGAGGNAYAIEHRATLGDTGWHQAAIVIDYNSFLVTSYLDGVEVTSESIPVASPSYRWTAGNPAGLGTFAVDPLFPDSVIPGDIFTAGQISDYDGMISILRFYDVDLFPDEIQDNYDAITDTFAAVERGDFDGDGVSGDADQLALVTFAENANTAAVADFTYPFPSTMGGVQTNDPAQDEGFVGDFAWDLDSGFNPGGQEPTFQFPAVNILEPVVMNDASMPHIREAFVMDGVEGFRGPKFEQAEDNSGLQTTFWLHFDDVTGSHCLFEAGGGGVGFSIVSLGDDLAVGINTSANDGFDEATITAPDVLTPGWHRIDFVVRRFASATNGQGIELSLDGAQVAQFGDLPGPDGVFGTDPLDPFGADDINQFSVTAGGNTNFIGGNQAGYGQIQGSAYLPSGVLDTDLTPFNGLAGPIRLIQIQPTEADIQAQILADADQNTMNDRIDFDGDGEANFIDIIERLKMIDAGR